MPPTTSNGRHLHDRDRRAATRRDDLHGVGLEHRAGQRRRRTSRRSGRRRCSCATSSGSDRPRPSSPRRRRCRGRRRRLRRGSSRRRSTEQQRATGSTSHGSSTSCGLPQPPLGDELAERDVGLRLIEADASRRRGRASLAVLPHLRPATRARGRPAARRRRREIVRARPVSTSTISIQPADTAGSSNANALSISTRNTSCVAFSSDSSFSDARPRSSNRKSEMTGSSAVLRTKPPSVVLMLPLRRTSCRPRWCW